MESQSRAPDVFIVYQNSERLLADKLKDLLEAWGYEAFHCRQGDKDSSAYRSELRRRIRACDLVLLLLSREFQWSPYCQAEAGTTMALEKLFIPILIPPATMEEVNTCIAQVLEGCDFITATDPDFVPTLKSRVEREIAQSNQKLKTMVDELRKKADLDLRIPPGNDNHKNESICRDNVKTVVNDIVGKYKLYQPKKTLVRSWPSLGDSRCRESIVGNIRCSLESDAQETSISLVGVSLKFSLSLISKALQSVNRPKDRKKKKLKLTLVYMDYQSHILHALNVKDVELILRHFEKDWSETLAEWRKLCESASIELCDPVRRRTDYIPPRVGILIDEVILYAGRCTFQPFGDPRHPVFDLRVGENEYLFYRMDNNAPAVEREQAQAAIDEFNGCLQAYGVCQNNVGITPIWTSDNWINRLIKYIEDYKGVEAITFISGSARRFESLILASLRRGANVKIYVRESGNASRQIKDVTDRIRNNLERASSTLERLPFWHPATFRAVVIGNVAIGLQIYINAGDKVGGRSHGAEKNPDGARKIPLCFIITDCFEHFEDLKKSVLSFADGDHFHEAGATPTA
jgi:hypothetical protein